MNILILGTTGGGLSVTWIFILGSVSTLLALWVARSLGSRSSAASIHKVKSKDSALIAMEERNRIYRDIHDDIGSKLLTLLHTSKDPQHADLVRTIMQDLRDVVSRSHDASGSLLEVLAQIRDETEQRLDAVGGSLLWEIDKDVPDPELNDAQALHLFRISREAVSNALRHGLAHQLRIRAAHQDGILTLDYTDDGDASKKDSGQPGAGTLNMQSRARELHGSVNWTQGTLGGTKVILEFPIPSPSPPKQGARNLG